MLVLMSVLKVPIVKFTDCETAIKIEVGFSASISTGIQSVHFIRVIDNTSTILYLSNCLSVCLSVCIIPVVFVVSVDSTWGNL